MYLFTLNISLICYLALKDNPNISVYGKLIELAINNFKVLLKRYLGAKHQ